MLGHRQELHVGEPEVGHVLGELDGELPVGQTRPPGAEVHLVDAQRGGYRLPLCPAGEPRQVAPVIGRLEHHRGSGGRHLGVGGHRVGLLPPDAVLAADPVLVLSAGARCRGTNSSQTPDAPSDRIGWACPSQKLKSPATRTPRAFGAQTANEDPVTSPRTDPPRCAAQYRPGARPRSVARGHRGLARVPRAVPRRSGTGRARRPSAGTGRGHPARWGVQSCRRARRR